MMNGTMRYHTAAVVLGYFIYVFFFLLSFPFVCSIWPAASDGIGRNSKNHLSATRYSSVL
jgi:hypothetical protein